MIGLVVLVLTALVVETAEAGMRVAARSERAGLAYWLAATQNPTVDRRFGIPSGRALFGATGPAALARLDHKLEALVSGSKLRSSTDASASIKSAFGAAGPAVTVKSLPFSVPPPPGRVVDHVKLEGSVSQGSSSLQHEMTLMTEVDKCPRQSTLGVSTAEGQYDATESTRQAVEGGQVHVVTLHIYALDKWSVYVDSKATIHSIHQDPYPWDASLVADWTNYVEDPATGKRSHEASGRFALDIKLDGWNVEYFGSDYPGAKAPDPVAQGLMEQFMQMVATSLHRAAGRAELYWRTPNNCVALTLQPAKGLLRPGEETEVSAFLHRPGDMTLLRTNGEFTAAASPAGATVAPETGSFGKSHSVQRLQFTAPHSSSEPATLEDVTTSNLGIGAATQRFALAHHWPQTISLKIVEHRLGLIPPLPDDETTWMSSWVPIPTQCDVDSYVGTCHYRLQDGSVTLSAGVTGDPTSSWCHYPSVTASVASTPAHSNGIPNELTLFEPVGGPQFITVELEADPVTMYPDSCQNAPADPITQNLDRSGGTPGLATWDGEQTSFHSAPPPAGEDSWDDVSYEMSY